MDHFFPIRIFPAGTALGGTASVESGGIELQFLDRLESIQFALTSPGTADAKLEYATSKDGITWGAYTDQDAILDSSLASYAATPTGFHTIALPNPLAQWVRFKATGLAGNDAGTTLEASVLARE